jgi:signal transduction histidine kinase
VNADTQATPAKPAVPSLNVLSRVGLMARCIAHDLNNHLTAAYGQIELARIRTAAADPQSRHIWHARSELEFCADLISYLMPGGPAGVAAHDTNADPHEVLESVLERCAPTLEANGVTATPQLAPGQFTVAAPAWALKHVFTNLIGNACDAMQDGGELHIASMRRYGRFQIIIRDNGPGIADEDIDRVFDPSFTTKDRALGHGLGLATCQAAAEHFGGAVSVESGGGPGAAFTVAFDLAVGSRASG